MVIGLDIALAELNPNDKYRLALSVSPSPPIHYWLADLRFAATNESVYLIPLIEHEYTVVVPDSAGNPKQYRVRPRSSFHISLHERGVVRVSSRGQNIVVRPPTTETRATLGPVFAMIIRSMAGLGKVRMKEIKSPTGVAKQIDSPPGVRALVLPGAWRPGPVGIRLDRSPRGGDWTAPPLGDLAQAHFHFTVRGKSVQYHVVVWQHMNLESVSGDIAILWPQSERRRNRSRVDD